MRSVGRLDWSRDGTMGLVGEERRTERRMQEHRIDENEEESSQEREMKEAFWG